MKNMSIHTFLVTALSLGMAANALNAQGFERINTLNAGFINDYIQHNNEVYVTSNMGVYRSAPGGASWQLLNTGMERFDVFSLGSSGSTLLAGQTNHLLYKSTDNGNSWTAIEGDNIVGNFQSIDYDNGNFYTTSGLRLLKSVDDGDTWSELLRVPNNLANNILAQNDTLVVSTIDTVYVSPDGGNNWLKRYEGFYSGYNYNTQWLLRGGRLFFSIPHGGLVTSDDLGATWTQAEEIGSFAGSVIEHAGALFIVANDSLYSSVNNGDSWSLVNPSTPMLTRRLFSDGNTLYASGTYGVFTSTNNGLSFERQASGYLGNSILDVNCLNEVYFCTPGQAAKSSDHGNSFTYLNGPVGPFTDLAQVNSFTIANQQLYALTNFGPYRSADGGNTFESIENNMPDFSSIRTMIRLSSGRLMAGGQPGVFVSDDDGQTWTQTGSNPIQPIALHQRNGVIYSINSQTVSTSSDNGQTWNTSPVLFNIRSFHANSEYMFIATGVELRRSADGENWEDITPNVGEPGVRSAVYGIGSTLFVGNGHGRLLMSNDQGNSWTEISDGLPLLNSESVDFSPFFIRSDEAYLYVFIRYNGLYRKPLSALGITGGDCPDLITSVEPRKLEEQFIPIPNPSSNSFSLKLNAPSHLYLMNAAGQIVMEQKASDVAAFQTTDLPAGMYMLRVSDSNGTRTHRVAVIRQ